jgi:hypothetical protein
MNREPNPPYGYVVSFIRYHERGFAAPASHFMRGLFYHYGVELHNFTSNAISQAATFVSVCEGFLGIPANWDLWVHLFRAELHTLVTPEPRMHRAVRAGSVSISPRESRRELYIPCTMTSNNAEWERGWFYLHNDEPGLPSYTSKVLKEKADSWWHGVSPSSRQDWLESALLVLKSLADAGLGEQQGLSPPATSEDSSSGEEVEESDGGQALPERWEPAPPHRGPRRRRRSKRLGWVQERPPPGGPRKRRRAPRMCRRMPRRCWRGPRRCWCAPRRRLAVRQWRRRPQPQCPSSP